MILLKRISIIFFTLILMLGVTGCMNYDTTPNITNNESLESVQEKVITHLEGKYKKSFECLASESASALKDYYTFIISETNSGRKSDEFKAFYFPKNENPYKDAYYGHILRGLITEELISSSVINETSFKTFIKFRNTAFSDELGLDTSLKNAVEAEGTIDSIVYLFGIKNIDIDLVISELKSQGITGTLYFYEVNLDTFEILSYETYEEIISDIISKKIDITSENKASIE